MPKSITYIRAWLIAGIVLIGVMVIVGGITRLTGSGLSIVEWKPITGTVPPLSENDWNKEFNLYKQYPQYQLMNYHMTLSEFKQIYFWEYIHRLLGRVIGLIFIIPFLIFYFKGWLSKPLMQKLLLIFLLGGLQGFVGWYMVRSGLSTQPHVSHFRLAAHQGMALLLMSVILWITLSLRAERRTLVRSSRLLRVSLFILMLLVIQITWGALVAGLKAGYSYTNFPWVGDSFFPNSYIVSTAPYFHNGVLLQFTHRWLAFFVLFGILSIYLLSRSDLEVRKYAKRLVALGLVQVLLGIATLMLSVPITLGVLHQFVAILLLMVMLSIIHIQLYKPLSNDEVNAES